MEISNLESNKSENFMDSKALNLFWSNRMNVYLVLALAISY